MRWLMSCTTKREEAGCSPSESESLAICQVSLTARPGFTHSLQLGHPQFEMMQESSCSVLGT